MTHKDKVAIRKAIVQLRGIEEREMAGYDDPITEYYGSDAADAVSWAAREARKRVLRTACKSALVCRLLRYSANDEALSVLERFAYQQQLIKGRLVWELAQDAEAMRQQYANG